MSTTNKGLDSTGSEAESTRLAQALSYVEHALRVARVRDASWLQILDANEIALLASANAVGAASGSPTPLAWRAPSPTAPMLVTHLHDPVAASAVKHWLRQYYPDDHRVMLLSTPGTEEAESLWTPLVDLDHQAEAGGAVTVYVPPLADNDNVRTFAGMMQLTRRLRGPGGCPWDQEQTHASLKPHLLEETYEVLDALDAAEPAAIAEELGDLLYQITIHAQVAAEAGEFTIEDVLQNIITKLIGRHPHVFGDLELDSAQDVLHAWEGFKQRQKPKRASVFEGIPRGLPALPQSNLMQKRAANLGFEWTTIDEVIDKVEEELSELRAEIANGGAKESQRDELGDIFFALVSVARHLRIDPEEALRLANQKFASRFQRVESMAKEQGQELRDLTAEELDALWNHAKEQAREGSEQEIVELPASSESQAHTSPTENWEQLHRAEG